MLRNLKNKARSILNLKRVYSSEVFYSVLKDTVESKFVTAPASGRVLILAPHPDDEVIGCGGALIRHLERKDQVKIIYLTDGSLGFKAFHKHSSQERKKMVRTREEEAKSLRKFGKLDQVFLRFPDSRLDSSKSLESYLTQALKDYQPDIIYTPYLLDLLSDHKATSQTLAKSLKKAGQNSIINQYEVWSPAFCNLYLSIDDVIEKKKEIFKIYKSQLDSRDYIKSIEGLAAYRAVIFGKSNYAESYLSTNTKLFRKLAELSS